MTRHALRPSFWATLLVSSLTLGWPRPGATAEFLRGDVDASGRLAVTDAIRILGFLFLGDGAAVTCKDAADADDNGALEVSDALFVLNALFRGGIVPPAPFPFCGEDPSADGLDCSQWKECPPVFQFFDRDFQAGAVFFVIDRSGTQLDAGELGKSNAETAKTIAAFSESVQFGVFYADKGLIKFPASGQPAEATAEMKDAAVSFVHSMVGGSGSCDIPALLAAIQMARNATSAEKVIFYLTDGGGTCNGGGETPYLTQMRKEVTEANAGLARIFTVGMEASAPLNRKHLEQLAAMNGGSYFQGAP